MKYDFVIFGASGFTGQFVVEFLARAVAKEDAKSAPSWAISGRNEAKLAKVLDNASKTTNMDLSKTPIIICDTSDDESVASMCKQAKIVLNCVGPYRFFGEQIVSACVKAGTHHIDISGEPQFLEKMQLKYHEEASKNKAYVIGACGFDSIPSDVGHVLLADKMEGDVNTVEMFLRIQTPPNLSGPKLNFGTWQSAIHGLANESELKPLRRQLYPERLPSLKPKLEKKSVIHYSDVVDSYCLPFLGSDRSIMMRTQRARYHNDNKRPTQIGCYMTVPSYFAAIMMIIGGAIFAILAKTKFGRWLLESYPEFFSFGTASKSGPSKEMAENTNFVLTLRGKGWKESVSDPKTDHADPPNREVQVKVSGKNIGYGATCELMVQSAMVIHHELDKMPGQGGVLTPGYAFAKTTLVDRLNKNDVPFEVTVKDI